MIPLRLSEIADITGGARHGDDVLVDGPVVTDSRQAGPGSLYVARIGEHADGHDFVPGAAAAGAVAALTTRPVAQLPYVLVPGDVQDAFAALASAVVDRVPGLRVIGVTGSSGKTTTKDLLAAVLSRHGETVANVGSLNSEVGVPLTVCRLTPTSRHLVLEMGARGIGHVAYLATMTRPGIGLVLNVGSAHVGEFGSREVIARAKAELVAALPGDGLAVLFADDPLVAAMAADSPAPVCRFGRRSPDADVRATDVTLGADGAASFTLHAGGERAPVSLQLLGDHQVDNALAAAACALAVGMGLPDVAAALSQARPASRYRMERHERPDGVVVVNDAYNANPESMSAALRTLAAMRGANGGGRAWAVVGEMLELGDASEAEHRAVGDLAARLGLDRLVAVGAGASSAAAGARSGGMSPDATPVVATVDDALDLLRADLRPGDVVLVKSSHSSGLRVLGDALVAEPGTTGETR